MTSKQMGLQVAEYKPEEHYDAVKDKWFGLRTPDGR
jgi:outer membrane protein